MSKKNETIYLEREPPTQRDIDYLERDCGQSLAEQAKLIADTIEKATLDSILDKQSKEAERAC